MKLFFSVGEPSGDEHAAHLIEELKRRRPDVQAVGFGGDKMEQAGCKLDFRLTDLAVMGFVRVVPMLAKFYRVANLAKRIFETDPPDAVILVDFPGFNWHIARYAKACGIPVFYYLPPQIWAWATWRVERMRKFVDHILCALPFEPEWYRERGIEAEFVGHPALEAFQHKRLDAEFERQYSPSDPVIGILPGSRNHEVQANWPVQLQIAKKLHAKAPDVRFAVACYKEKHLEHCRRSLKNLNAPLPIDLYIGKTSEIIERAQACLMVSGSVSLELLARGTPAVVLYRVSWPMYWFGLRYIECPYFSLPNLFAGRHLMPEFAVVGCTRNFEQQMADTLAWWLNDRDELARRAEQMLAQRDAAMLNDAIGTAASAVLKRFDFLRQKQAA